MVSGFRFSNSPAIYLTPSWFLDRPHGVSSSLQVLDEVGGCGVTLLSVASFLAFQVFNLNAPVPPGTEADTLKQPGQYPSAYSPGFGSQAPHPAEQAELQPGKGRALRRSPHGAFSEGPGSAPQL